ncbi:MAG: acyl-CoA/acyl-ACP dehydrogenase [Actinomycetota bacterium]|nr:acyl-CoA/acyl-ACP dehydrogenase [Actinomycetota bacterium]
MTVLSAEHVGLRDSVRGLLTKRSSSAAVRSAMMTENGYDEQLWALLCTQIGVAGLSIPEQYGGAGATLFETHLILEELGRTLTPAPMLGSAVLSAHLLLALGDTDACRRLLPQIAAGTAIAAVCWAGPDGRWDPAGSAVDAQARPDSPEFTLCGQTYYVLDGDLADVLLVVADAGAGPAVFEVDPHQSGVSRTHEQSMDHTRRLARVRLDGVRGRRIGDAAAAALTRARDIACIALSAEQVGGATRILEMTVDYSKVRVQFGRPIGSFQALKHRMADLHVLVEAARSASYGAVEGSVPPAVAKVYCSEAFFTVAAEAIQLHGGIAITWEHDAHLYFKRAHGSSQLFGSPGEYVARITPAAAAARESE